LLKLFNDQVNASDKISIESQIRPTLAKSFTNENNSNNTECIGKICPKWLESHRSILPTLDVIGNISSSINILLLNGENDSQTPVQQALLLK
jgi:uncharacterized protein